MIETFAALAEPNRLRIVELLRAGPQGVNEISGSLRLNQPQVSKHLRVLKEVGLVEVAPRAQQRLHALKPAPLRELHDWLEQYRARWDARFLALDDVLAELESQPLPEAPQDPPPRPPNVVKPHGRRKRK